MKNELKIKWKMENYEHKNEEIERKKNEKKKKKGKSIKFKLNYFDLVVHAYEG